MFFKNDYVKQKEKKVSYYIKIYTHKKIIKKKIARIDA